MSSISRHSGDNFGGITKLFYALHSEVNQSIDWLKVPFTISQAFIDSNFFRIKFENKTGSYTVKKTNTAQGPVYGVAVKIDLHKDRQDIADQIEAVGDRKLITIIQSLNGAFYLLGSKEAGLKQAEIFNTGQVPSDLNGYVFQFTGEFLKKPEIITIL